MSDRCPQDRHNVTNIGEEPLFCGACLDEEKVIVTRMAKVLVYTELATDLNERAVTLFLHREDAAAQAFRDLAEDYSVKIEESKAEVEAQ